MIIYVSFDIYTQIQNIIYSRSEITRVDGDFRMVIFLIVATWNVLSSGVTLLVYCCSKYLKQWLPQMSRFELCFPLVLLP
jgi:hypothetical protein